jgi:hypothetical protein
MILLKELITLKLKLDKKIINIDTANSDIKENFC